MVVRLNCPDADQNAFIDEVVEQRQGGANAQFFTDIKADWKTRVQAYLTASGNPSVIKPWPSVQLHAKKFQNLYLNPAEDSVQRPVLATLRSRELQLCPGCGEDGTPNTLDHYLPKQTYPEFSITACNLFPMCDICQGKKSTATVGAANERLFLHPYFDQFIDVQVLHLQIGQPYEAPASMTLTPRPGLGPEQTALVARHLKHLAISARYHHFFKDEYLRLLRLVRTIRQKGMDVVANLELFRENALNKSINSWGHVFYAGVLADPGLIDYLRQGQLPAHL
jgi:5-methylcytosine-specific restriction endonuclease McrA